MKAKTRKTQPRNSATATACDEVGRILGDSLTMQKFTLTFFPWSDEGNNGTPLITQDFWLTALDSHRMAVNVAQAAKPFLPKHVC